MKVYSSGGGLDVGACVWFPHGGTPSGGTWLKANGQNVSRTVYSALFGKFGTTWGAGDGSTTFGLPDMRRRSPVGAGGTGTSLLANTVGSYGGEEKHALTADENGPHSHTFGIGGDSGGSPVTVQWSPSNNSSKSTNSSGSGTAHNTYHPVAAGEFWVKAA